MSKVHEQSFISPSKEFTPVPFWFWNDDLNENRIKAQIKAMDEKGVNGFVLHPRIGLPDHVAYLSETFMHYVVTAVEEAARRKMKVILYDEGMYPSGAANGQVVRENKEFKSRGLGMKTVCTKKELDATVRSFIPEQRLVSLQKAVYHSDLNLVDKHTIQIVDNIHKPDSLAAGEVYLLFYETPTNGTIRGIHYEEDDGEPNAPASADLLNPDAVAAFIRLTHDVYDRYLSSHFAKTVVGFFTDEPDIMGRNAKKELIPWTAHFTDRLNQDVCEKDLSLLWLNQDQYAQSVRHNFKKMVNDRLSDVYYRRLYEWCEHKRIALTGHPAGSDEIGLMQCFHIPGQDVVWRWVAPENNLGIEGVHSAAAKCSSDAARHRGIRRNLNEFAGVCGKNHGWDLTPGDFKWYIDWLAVRGVNLYCPHAFYYSVNGRKRSHERPPDVGFHNSWWPHYQLFSDYMKRLSWLMTDSVNLAETAVICPGDRMPRQAAKLLYENQIEFNYLEETLLDKTSVKNGKLSIEKQLYSVLIVEDEDAFAPDTLTKLKKLQQKGLRIITWEISSENQTIKDILAQVKPSLTLEPPFPHMRISTVLKDSCTYHLLVNEGSVMYEGLIRLESQGDMEIWNPWTGNMAKVSRDSMKDEGGTALKLQANESVILKEINGQSHKPEAGDLFIQTEVTLSSSQWETAKGSSLPEYEDLSDWSLREDMAFFSGTLTYRKTFVLDYRAEDYEHVLDAGEVCEIAQLFINGQFMGVRMWAPYTFSIAEKVLRQGENSIELKVTNSKTNEMDHVRAKSGLIGPVKLFAGFQR